MDRIEEKARELFVAGARVSIGDEDPGNQTREFSVSFGDTHRSGCTSNWGDSIADVLQLSDDEETDEIVWAIEALTNPKPVVEAGVTWERFFNSLTPAQRQQPVRVVTVSDDRDREPTSFEPSQMALRQDDPAQVALIVDLDICDPSPEWRQHKYVNL